MTSSAMIRRISLVRNDVSEECIASIVRVITEATTERCEDTVYLSNVLRLLVTANVIPRSPIFVTPKTVATRFS
jgi:hypothetical protein